MTKKKTDEEQRHPMTAGDLKQDEHNYRKHSETNKARIKKSIDEAGLGRSVVIDADGVLVAGNGVQSVVDPNTPVRVVETDGTELVVVKRTDLHTGDPRRKTLAFADNATGDDVEWDMEAIEADGWEQDELEDWGVVECKDEGDGGGEGNKKEAQEDDFDPDTPVETICKRGDVWRLGNHRLMCGDSTDAGSVALLMDGEKADMCLTDPPYGMHLDTDFSTIKGSLKIVGRKNGTKGNKYERVIGDNDDFKPELINTIFDNLGHCKECFLFGADYFAELLPDKNKGSWLVWDKRKESQADAIGSEFELIWSKQNHKRRVLRHDWFGFLSSQNGSDARNRVHPTQKPITLLADIINQWGKDAQIIVDIYGGSGSTLIAAEQLNRKCYMMELDPHYCDVIIDRWEKFTGNKAEKLK